MKNPIIVNALLLCSLAAHECRAQKPVQWALSVASILGTSSYTVTRQGGNVPSTGLKECIQAPVRVFKDVAGDVQEEVRITCEVGLSAKVELIQTCYVAKPDRSFGAMKVDDTLSKYTIALSCSNL